MSLSSETAIDEAPAGGFVCLVDGDGKYNSSESKVKQLIEKVDPKGDRDYSIVGIMGCQSSGKSTLLNKLFRTKFQVMNSQMGRSQTTKGIWLDAARNTSNLAIMDLEGTDSGERGEDRTTFERQVILYGLSLCEILIVNQWTTDIGRYSGSNYGILKTVFEVNLQLFKNQARTMLLFIIRDHHEKSQPFAMLKDKMMTELTHIWNKDIRKPEGQQDAKLEDYFDLRFEPLPSPIFEAEAFDAATSAVREKFVNAQTPGSFLATEYHGQKSVPADGFAHYAETIWNTIRTNQDLNLPSQRELLSTFRCDELAAAAFAEYHAATTSIRADCGKGLVADLGARLGPAIASALQQYDAGAKKYLPVLVEKKRAELLAKLSEQCVELLQLQMTYVVSAATAALTAALDRAIPANKSCDDFSGVVARVTAAEAARFRAAAAALSAGLPQEVKFSTDRFDAEYARHAQAATSVVRTRQIKQVAEEGAQLLHDKSAAELTALLQAGGQGMWSRVGLVFGDAFNSAFLAIEPKLADVKARPNEVRSVERLIVAKGQVVFTDASMQHASGVQVRMRDVFDSEFTRDHEGLPRRWRVEDDVRAEWSSARTHALALLPLFQRCRVSDFWGARVAGVMNGDVAWDEKDEDESPASASASAAAAAAAAASAAAETSSPPESLRRAYSREADFGDALTRRMSVFAPASTSSELISAETVATIERNFSRYTESVLFEAQSAQEQARAQQGLPTWVYAVMAVLGFNEAMAILTSPLVIYPAILVGLVVIVLMQAGLWPAVWTAVKFSANQLYQQGYLALHGRPPPAPKTKRAESVQLETLSGPFSSSAVDAPNRPGSPVDDDKADGGFPSAAGVRNRRTGGASESG